MSATAVEVRPPLWRRLIGFNALTGVVLGVGGYYLGWFRRAPHHGRASRYFADIDQNDISVFLGYFLGVAGFLIGLGFGVYPWARLRGYPPSLREKETAGRRPLLRPLHRPQGRRHPVPVRDRALLLHRRPERDADPRRAAAPDQPGVPGRAST